jgi:ribosomal protein S18 acetylase RimI-like enzyme
VSHGFLIRSARWPEDRARIAALDTSFLVERRLAVSLAADGARMSEERLAAPWRKSYPLDLPDAEVQAFGWATVAEQGGSIIGFGAGRFETWNQRANLAHLYVSPPARGRGVGRALVESALEDARGRSARCLWVETQDTNVPAVRFYEALGFARCGFDTTLYDPASSDRQEVAIFLARRLR